MPNIKSSVQDVKTTALRNNRNKSIKSAIKTATKKLETAIAEAQGEKARTTFQNFTSTIDQAVSKGVLHKNAAARKKSRLARKLAASAQ